MPVQALVQAAGGGTRLGLGPKSFVRLGGRTLLEHAVAACRSVAAQVIVAVPPAEVEAARALVAGDRVAVIPGGDSRSATTRLLVMQASAAWLLLHDVVHPFADEALVRRVLDAAIAHGAAAPAIPNAEFLYDRAGRLLHAPGDLLVGQKPIAFARTAAIDGYATLDREAAAGDPSFLTVLEKGGVRTRFVDGSGRNIKITTPADLELAGAMAALAG
ncbi:2-C-methyl-D-erythritol 4-phosphate cytidylyltransferase [Allostella humosa]|nr:2-C-methyl-D-erythritol 4-phosphate cytidylyltransferase [Stella humosa]